MTSIERVSHKSTEGSVYYNKYDELFRDEVFDCCVTFNAFSKVPGTAICF